MTATATLTRPSTISAVLAEGVACLRGAGIPSPHLDAKVILCDVLGLVREDLLRSPQMAVEPDDRERFDAAIRRRTRREPVSRIVGSREFWGLPFHLCADMLEPRPDSEVLVRAALEGISDPAAPLRILDLGTGSGCLVLALLSELPNASGLAIDRSYAAVRGAAGNARRLGLAPRARFLCADWCNGVEARFDLVMANPPYIPTHEIAGLEPEVARHDPRHALDGGPDGLHAYRQIGEQLPRLLARFGQAFLEIGAGQADAVSAILQSVGLSVDRVEADLAGRPRCLVVSYRER